VGTEFKISDTGSSPGSTLGIKVTGGASWDGALLTYGVSGDIATSYISLNLLDITAGSSDAPVTRYLDQAQLVNCVPFTILGIPTECHWPDDGNGQADINTTVQRGHTYRAYYEVYCAANSDLGSDSCDYASTALGYNMTLGALSIHLGNDQFGSTTAIQSQIATAVTTIATDITAATTTIAADITAATTTINNAISAAVTTIDNAIAAADADLTTKLNNGVTLILAGQDEQFIEDSLSTCTGHPILYMPASLGGKLEKVQAIVNRDLGHLRSMGVTPTFAQTYYNAAVASIGAHNYPAAWANFCNSYFHMVVHTNGTIPQP
jgi:hypothetical protein